MPQIVHVFPYRDYSWLMSFCRLLKRGRIELGVHIADVSHFVKPGSLTDSEARARLAYVVSSFFVHFLRPD